MKEGTISTKKEVRHISPLQIKGRWDEMSIQRKPISQMSTSLRQLKSSQEARALSYPLTETREDFDIFKILKTTSKTIRKTAELERISGLPLSISDQRTALKGYHTSIFEETKFTVGEWKEFIEKKFRKPVEKDFNAKVIPGKMLKDTDKMVVRTHNRVDEEGPILTNDIVGVVMTIEKGSVTLRFDFKDANIIDTVQTDTSFCDVNKTGQLVQCVLPRAASEFKRGNSHWFFLDRTKKAKFRFGYDVHHDVAELRFSDVTPDSFEEHPNIHGVVCLYSGDDPVGYDIVKFSEFFNDKCLVPRLRIPR